MLHTRRLPFRMQHIQVAVPEHMPCTKVVKAHVRFNARKLGGTPVCLNMWLDSHAEEATLSNTLVHVVRSGIQFNTLLHSNCASRRGAAGGTLGKR